MPSGETILSSGQGLLLMKSLLCCYSAFSDLDASTKSRFISLLAVDCDTSYQGLLDLAAIAFLLCLLLATILNI